jgi:hypothetical protein
MVEDMGLKIRCHWHDVAVEFHENLPTDSNVTSGGRTDIQVARQTD